MNKTQLNKLLHKEKLDAIFSMAAQTRLWYAGVQTSSGYLLIEPKSATLLVDGRYIEYAQKNAKKVKVKLISAQTLKALNKGFKRVGVEEEYLTIFQQEHVKKLFPKVKLIPFSSQKLRIIKSNEEIKMIKKAGSISIQALNKLKKDVKPGVTETSLAIKLETYQKKLGASKNSFDTIVVSGPRGALPHGQPSNKKIKNGELITVDCGSLFQGYASDITRTWQVGKVTNPKLLEIQKIVKQAQKMGIKAVKSGITTREIDKICRDYISNKGYGQYFVHSTGHGLGVDLHELPNLTFNKKHVEKLEPGMVITVEPGIYIKDLGGARFEDDILVTKTGHTILSKL